MGAQLIPEQPDYANEAERLVVESLRNELDDDDVIMVGVRMTDPQYGDVEVDALVLIEGAGAAVIEIKGGHVVYRQGGFVQIGDGEHPIRPTDQARNGMFSVRRYVEAAPDWSRGRLRATWLVALAHTPVRDDLGPQLPRERVIGSTDLAAAADLVRTLLADPANPTPVPARGWVDQVIDRLQGTWNDPAQVPLQAAAHARHIEEITASREFILRAAKRIPRLEFVGSAGSGKTWLAVEQARRWARDGAVCFVTYTRGVAEAVRHEFESVRVQQRPAFIGTFHQLAPRWGVPIEQGVDPSYWERDLPALMQAAAQALPNRDRFTAFVVDEAQDFADSWWPALLSSARDDGFRLAVFRDDEQAVFTGRRGRPDLDLVPFVLDENLRNTRQIVDSFRPLINAKPISRGGDGPAVERVQCAPGSEIEIADGVVEDLLDRRGWLPEQIALLTTRHRHPVQRERDADKTAYWRDFREYADVFYSTVSGFKGLERPVVVLAVNGFHDGVDPASVRYAGMSRARDLLVVVEPGV